MDSASRHLDFSNDQVFGQALVTRFLPVPYIALLIALAFITREFWIVLSVGTLQIFTNLSFSEYEKRTAAQVTTQRSFVLLYTLRLAINLLCETALLLMLGPGKLVWILVVPSIFAAPFAWSFRPAIIFSTIDYVVNLAVMIYIGESSAALLFFSAMTVGAFFIASALMNHFRKFLSAIRVTSVDLLKAEQEKSRVAMEAQQYRRLASMGQLAAGIAHEVNNPLSYVISNLEFVRRALKNDERIDPDILTALEDADEGAERVRYIVRDIKTFSRPHEAKKHHLVDINDVVASALNMMKNQINQRATIETELKDLPSVMADKAALGQVFVNLLANAVQAIDPSLNRQHTISIRTEYREENVLVTVSDTGDGIDEAIIDKIFDPFFTSKPLGIGTGLGLSIVQQIVTRCNGTIKVESQPGEGTTFTLCFPGVSEEEERSVTGSNTSSFRTMVRVKRALIVDDDRNLILGLSRQFNRCEVVGATSGPEALEILALDKKFDVILCDLIMPMMTGVETFEAVITEYPELQDKFVFMTGGAFTPQVQAFLDQDWVRCLNKPFTWVDLLRCLTLPGTPEQVRELAEISPSPQASSQVSN